MTAMEGSKVRLEEREDLGFYGEIGVLRRLPHLLRAGSLDDDYGIDNPDGSEYTRRNFGETCYLSGMPELSPGEYPDAETPGSQEYEREYRPTASADGETEGKAAPTDVSP